MNAIRTIGILLASLALIGVAEAQKGGGKPGGGGGGSGDTLSSLNCSTDQIARFNGTAWVCSKDGLGLKITDKNGLRVAYPIVSPIEFYGAYLLTHLTIDGQSEPFLLEGRKDYIGPRNYGGSLAFESQDCSGQKYFVYDAYGDWIERRHYAAFQDSQDSHQFTVFYSERQPAIETVNISTFAERDGCRCASYNGGSCGFWEMTVVKAVGDVLLTIPYELPLSLDTE